MEKALLIQNGFELEYELKLWTTTYLYLAYKNINKQFDLNEIHNLIKETEYIEFELNYAIYQLLEDSSYLETAYHQVKEEASAIDKELAAKFLSYPSPKAVLRDRRQHT